MKKIAIVTKYMMAGGIEKALINMLNTFSKEKYDVTLYVEKLGGDFFEDIPSYVNVKVIPEIECGNKERIGSALKSFKIGRSIEITKGLIHNYRNREYIDQCIGMCKILPKVEESYDLAIAYSAPVSLALYYVAYNIKANKKWTWIHNEVDQITVDIRDAKNVFKEYNKVFCVSKLAKEKFDLKLPEYKNKSEVFYNIMDFKLMEEKSKEKIEKSFDAKQYNILTVGRICEEKGQDIIPAIALKLKEKEINYKWYLIGEGALEEKLRKEIKRLQIENYIILLGKKLNPYPYFRNCNLYVQTSRQEGYGLTLTEAKYFLKPIISSNTAGAMEQIVNESNGIITEFGVDQFVEQIISLYHDSEKCKCIEKQLQKERIKLIENKKIEEKFKEI